MIEVPHRQLVRELIESRDLMTESEHWDWDEEVVFKYLTKGCKRNSLQRLEESDEV